MGRNDPQKCIREDSEANLEGRSEEGEWCKVVRRVQWVGEVEEDTGMIALGQMRHH